MTDPIEAMIRAGARVRRIVRWACVGVLLSLLAGQAAAAEREWLLLQAPTFSVVSALKEKEVRRWAGEFDQFVEALHRAYSIDTRRLPPLTIVLFRNDRDFAPYRVVTRSGQAKVSGVFYPDIAGSVIGLPGSHGSATTRHIMQHEAVHWFFSAYSRDMPLWLAEGIAEVFSTFEVKDGTGRLGDAIPEHLAYLQQVGLIPLEEFFRVTQDEALHGDDRFYPEAWAFVHYGLFGNRGADRDRLTKFVELLASESREAAFLQGYGRSYAEMDKLLEAYLKGGSYGVLEIELPDRSESFTVGPAEQTRVEYALGRFALGTNNFALAESHANTLVTARPDAPEGHALLAHARKEVGDQESAERAAARSIELGSTDPSLYLLAARIQVQRHARDDAPIDEILSTENARSIADTLEHSLTLEPRNPEAIELLVMALANVPELTAADRQALDAAQRYLPRSGLVLLARAAAANRAGDIEGAIAYLRDATSEARELPRRMRQATKRLDEYWVANRLSEQKLSVETLTELDSLDATLALAKTLPDASRPFLSSVEQMSDRSRVVRRFLEADAADSIGDYDQARTHLQAVLDDPAANDEHRAVAERKLRHLAD